MFQLSKNFFIYCIEKTHYPKNLWITSWIKTEAFGLRHGLRTLDVSDQFLIIEISSFFNNSLKIFSFPLSKENSRSNSFLEFARVDQRPVERIERVSSIFY